jgi:hypothetical protein
MSHHCEEGLVKSLSYEKKTNSAYGESAAGQLPVSYRQFAAGAKPVLLQ